MGKVIPRQRDTAVLNKSLPPTVVGLYNKPLIKTPAEIHAEATAAAALAGSPSPAAPTSLDTPASIAVENHRTPSNDSISRMIYDIAPDCVQVDGRRLRAARVAASTMANYSDVLAEISSVMVQANPAQARTHQIGRALGGVRTVRLQDDRRPTV